MAKKKAGSKKPKAKKPARKARPKKARARKPKPTDLEGRAAFLSAELRKVRTQMLQNESALAKLIAEKIGVEDRLNRQLMRTISEEKSVLAMVKRGAARKQASLKEKIVSLKTINKVYEEKKSRIAEAKRRQAALKRQLQSLESKLGA